MAIHLNLYHEALRSEQQRRRDPLKLSMMGLAVIILLMLAYYFISYGSVRGSLAKQRAVEAEWATLEPKAKQAEKDRPEVENRLKVSETVLSRIDGRFFWAPFLERILALVPKEVQITSLSGEIPQQSPGTFVVSVSGLAAGEEPRTVAESLRIAMLEKLGETYKGLSATFRALDDSEEMVVLNGRKLRTVSFVILLQYSPAAGSSGTSVTPATR